MLLTSLLSLHYALQTLTGTVRSDLAVIESTVGAAEIAISDLRGSQPTVQVWLQPCKRFKFIFIQCLQYFKILSLVHYVYDCTLVVSIVT